MSVGARIAKARERAGLNKNQLARELGTSWQHVDHWEKDRTEPSLASVRRIAEVLRTTVDAIIGDPGGALDSPLEQFLTALAPRDLSADEEAWLRRAPVDPREASPEDYRRLLEGLRRISHRPKSGRRRRVDGEALSRAIQRRKAGPA